MHAHIPHMHNFTHTTQQTLYKHICAIHKCQQACSHVYNTCHIPYTCTHSHTIHQTYDTHIQHTCHYHIHAHTYTDAHVHIIPPCYMHPHTTHIHTYSSHTSHTDAPTPTLLRIPLPGQVLWGSTVCWLVWNSGTCSSSRFLLSSTWNGWRLGKSFQRRKWKIHFSCCCSTTWKRHLKRCQAMIQEQAWALSQGSHSVN